MTQYYFVAYKDKLPQLNIEVEVFFDLHNRTWTIDKNTAFNFLTEQAALNFISIMCSGDSDSKMYVHKLSSNTK